MDIGEQFKRRVDEGKVGRVLASIATTPNQREKPAPGDLSGTFDFWFDGGAARNITGWTEYEFADGTRARVDFLPGLHVVIKFTNGYGVVVSQVDPDFDIGFFKSKSQQP